jgi:putative glycosyltransferase (TIGR04372 family)
MFQWCTRPPNIGQDKLWFDLPIETEADRIRAREYLVKQLEDPVDVRMNPKDEALGQKMAVDLGLSVDCRYVCLHVRETGFYGPKEGIGKTVRNGTVANFIPAIKFLVKNGYKVVRLGDPTMTPLPDVAGLIDYPFSTQKSHLMDIWLIKHCEFYIGHNSGPMDVVYLFHKPILIPNVAEFIMGNPARVGDLCILKHVFSKKEQRYLSVRELVELYLMNDTKCFHDPDLEFVENTPDELLDLVREYLTDNLLARGKDSRSRLQKAVLERRWNLDKSFIQDPTISNVNKSRFTCRLLGYSGLIANTYLEKNYADDSLNRKEANESPAVC